MVLQQEPMIKDSYDTTSHESYLYSDHFDLVTPDGTITELELVSDREAVAEVFMHEISPAFVGFSIDKELIFFNIKSTLAQIGLEGVCEELQLDPRHRCAQARVRLRAIGNLAPIFLKQLRVGAEIGKLFAADDRRRVRNPDYLSRMFGRSDSHGRPLLSLGGMQGSEDLILDRVDGRTVAYLTLQNGTVEYEDSIYGLLPTIAQALNNGLSVRELLRLHQRWNPHAARNVAPNDLLLVRTLPLHIRTVFGVVVNDLLAEGYRHTSASVLQPDTSNSGDIYELYGKSTREITDIPLEFYTLEPHREHVFFEDRDQLQSCLDDSHAICQAFHTAPEPLEMRAAVFVVKGEQMCNLKAEDWVMREPRRHEFPGSEHAERQAVMVERYIRQQPAYPFLEAMEKDLITSQGVLLVRHFPSPLEKRMFLSTFVRRCLKGIYFQYPSQSFEAYFSHEDRALMNDLVKFGIPIYWVDDQSQAVLKYVQKPDEDSGLFVPLESVDRFMKSTVFGVYGSNLVEGDFEEELTRLLAGVQELRKSADHDLLRPGVPLALVTGGGPGAMEVGNRVAQKLDILSCGYIVDFRTKAEAVVNEQKQNPHVEAKMTYRLDKLVERQAEFNLDFPIFLTGGIGTDFELALEEVRRKVGSVDPTPILLFGAPEYWRAKISSRFQQNLASGTIKGSEWLSNCFFCIQHAEQGLKVYKEFFDGTLPIGKDGPIYEDGFVVVE